MNHPNLALMRHYGTAGVFFEKTAGASPFAERVTAAIFAGSMVHSAGVEMDRQRLEAHQMNEQFRLAEERKMAPVNQSLMHARAPMILPSGSDVPVGWDEGMVRLASIAREVGEGLAKSAVSAPPPNWKGKALGYGALLGGGYLALKGVNSGLGWLSRPAPAQQNWGSPGTQVPMGVNQYGYPQPGSPLMG